MGGGLAFLSKKSFNPSNISNQKQVWEARQRTEQERKRAAERADQLRRERDDEDLARARGGDRLGDRAALKFMYGVPPGLSSASTGGVGEGEAAAAEEQGGTDLTKRRPGDDEAAAAFRRMLAGECPLQAGDQRAESGAASVDTATTAVDEAGAGGGTGVDNRTQLEKAVGRRDTNRALTLDEQIARFPQLRHAPMAKGMDRTNVNVNFKPLGATLRNVRCLKCGVWGHSRGDRECKQSGWDPFGGVRTGIGPAASADGDRAVPKNDVQTVSGHDGGDEVSHPSAILSDRERPGCSMNEKKEVSEKGYSSANCSEEEERERKRRRRKRRKDERKRSRKRSRKHSTSSRRRHREKDDHGRCSSEQKDARKERGAECCSDTDQSKLRNDEGRQRRKRERRTRKTTRRRSPSMSRSMSSSSPSSSASASPSRGKRPQYNDRHRH